MTNTDRAAVEAMATRLFGAASLRGVLLLLDRYPAPGTTSTPAGTARVHLAVLHLSEGRIDRLKHFVAQAIADYRDVLYWSGL